MECSMFLKLAEVCILFTICKFLESLDISAIDIRVGKVVKVEKHSKSRKLYIESIDIGGRKPLTVVSGLQDYVPINELQVIP